MASTRQGISGWCRRRLDHFWTWGVFVETSPPPPPPPWPLYCSSHSTKAINIITPTATCSTLHSNMPLLHSCQSTPPSPPPLTLSQYFRYSCITNLGIQWLGQSLLGCVNDTEANRKRVWWVFIFRIFSYPPFRIFIFEARKSLAIKSFRKWNKS